jgi:NADPH:quinone reductase
VIDTLGVSDGDIVLVLGASGGVGSLATQLAMASGATVIGSASAPHQTYVKSIGAEPVQSTATTLLNSSESTLPPA